MAKRQYVGEVFRRCPRPGQKPLHRFTVEADHAGDALDKVGELAKQKGVDRAYISLTGGKQ